jgi:GNAT superfamily N-acetyltransferase
LLDRASDVRRIAMQIRHARHGDEAQLAFLLEDHERHYGNPVADGAGAKGASFLVESPPGGTLCLVAEQDGGRLVGFAILNPYFPGPKLTHGLYLKELYVTSDARSARVGEKLIDAIRGLAKQRGDTPRPVDDGRRERWLSALLRPSRDAAREEGLLRDGRLTR